MPSDPMQGVDKTDAHWRYPREVWMPRVASIVRGVCGPITLKHARLSVIRHRLLMALTVSDFAFCDGLDDQLDAIEEKLVRDREAAE